MAPTISPRTQRWFAPQPSTVLCAALAAVAGCKPKAPPVLFHSDARVAARVDAATDGAAAPPAAFTPVEGIAVAGDGSSLTVDGATLRAVDGERFTAWLAIDLDGDGTSSDLAIARTGADQRARPAALYRRLGSGFEEVPFVGAAPTDARCADASLRLTSPRSVAFSWRCPVAPDAFFDGQTLAEEQTLVAVTTPPAVRERASLLAGPLPDTALSLQLEGRDLDGDSRDEVLVTLAAGRPNAPPRASARLTFFERAGALARDTTEPVASLQANVTAARHALTRGRSGALEALAALDDLQRLRRAFCADSGLARLRFQRATGFDCAGAPSAAAADLYARALLNVGELPAAEAQLSADTATDFGAVTNERVLADLERATLVERSATARPGPSASVALDALAPARLRALAFDRANNPTRIDLRGPATGTVDLATLTHSPGTPGTIADVLPRPPHGAFVVAGLVDTCAGVAIVRCTNQLETCTASPITEGTTALPPGAERVLLPALPPVAFARRCATTPAAVQGVGPRRSRVLGVASDGVLVALHRRLYHAAATGEVRALTPGDAPGTGYGLGAAVNDAGSAVAQAGLGGLWVRERNAWRRWSPEALAGRFAQLTDITVSGDARTVAALVDTQLWVLERPHAVRRR